MLVRLLFVAATDASNFDGQFAVFSVECYIDMSQFLLVCSCVWERIKNIAEIMQALMKISTYQ